MPRCNEDFVDTLVRVNGRMRKLFDARAREQGLTLSRARLLVQLAREDGQTQITLAQKLDVEQPSIVGLVDALEKAGMVERRAEGSDRRSRRVFLTDAARGRAAELLTFVAGVRAEVLRDVPQDDLRAANAVLLRIMGNLDRGGGDG